MPKRGHPEHVLVEVEAAAHRARARSGSDSSERHDHDGERRRAQRGVRLPRHEEDGDAPSERQADEPREQVRRSPAAARRAAVLRRAGPHRARRRARGAPAITAMRRRGRSSRAPWARAPRRPRRRPRRASRCSETRGGDGDRRGDGDDDARAASRPRVDGRSSCVAGVVGVGAHLVYPPGPRVTTSALAAARRWIVFVRTSPKAFFTSRFTVCDLPGSTCTFSVVSAPKSGWSGLPVAVGVPAVAVPDARRRGHDVVVVARVDHRRVRVRHGEEPGHDGEADDHHRGVDVHDAVLERAQHGARRARRPAP